MRGYQASGEGGVPKTVKPSTQNLCVLLKNPSTPHPRSSDGGTVQSCRCQRRDGRATLPGGATNAPKGLARANLHLQEVPTTPHQSAEDLQRVQFMRVVEKKE